MVKSKKILSSLTSFIMLVSIFNFSIFSVSNKAYAQTTNRLCGINRYVTATEISKSGWTTKSNYAVIATGADFPDALCAAPLAKKYNAPILLTEAGSLSTSTSDELKRLNVQTAFIIGGTGVVSQETENQIKKLNIITVRIAGATRYETSEKVAEQLGKPAGVVIATGNNFPDALSIAPIAAMQGMPILLSNSNSIPSAVKTYLDKNINTITVSYVVGGTGVISDNVKNLLKSPERLAGNNRYDTNIAILDKFSSIFNMSNIYLATGDNFPDALACSALSAFTKSPLVLINEAPSNSTIDYINSNINSIVTVTAIGGYGVISDNILQNTANDFPDTVISFNDKNLNSVIRTIINKPTNNILRKDVSNITSLDLSGMQINDLSGIENLVNLTILKLGSKTNNDKTNSFNTVKDLTKLKGLTKLQVLDLSCNQISNISPISNFKNLTTLNLSNNKISDITSLNKMINLQNLYLYNNQIPDLSVLNNLSALKNADLSYNKVSTLAANEFSNLSDLQNLDLSNNLITTVPANTFNGLNNLQVLDLCFNQISVTFSNSFYGLSGLVNLNLGNTQISDLSVLSSLITLQKLDLYGNNNITDITALGNLNNLTSLNINGNQISSLLPISSLTKLQSLDFSNNKISDITSLKSLTNLKYLYLCNNTVSDISVLDSLNNLTDINMSDNNVSASDINNFKASHPNCNIVY